MTAVLGAGVLLSSCVNGTEPVASSAEVEASQSDCVRFVVYDDPDWEFRQGIDYTMGLGPLDNVEPSLDWYSDYNRLVALPDGVSWEEFRIRISGHGVSVDDHAGELLRVSFLASEINDGKTLVWAGSDTDPAVVTMAMRPDYTVMLLSYELEAEELIEVASDLRPVCVAEWVQAGGQILDCVPFEEGCGFDT